jgi:hypothetical protein
VHRNKRHHYLLSPMSLCSVLCSHAPLFSALVLLSALLAVLLTLPPQSLTALLASPLSPSASLTPPHLRRPLLTLAPRCSPCPLALLTLPPFSRYPTLALPALSPCLVCHPSRHNPLLLSLLALLRLLHTNTHIRSAILIRLPPSVRRARSHQGPRRLPRPAQVQGRRINVAQLRN